MTQDAKKGFVHYDISPEICSATLTVECHEPLVELSEASRKIVIDIEETSRAAQGIGKGRCFVRKSVAQRLAKVQEGLPAGIMLKVIDAYRPLSAQKKLWEQVFSEVKLKGLGDAQAAEETDKWVANPAKITPPHSTGGTVDLTLCDESGVELDMGSPPNSLGPRSLTDARLSEASRKNRDLLIGVMSNGGFANYIREWWHWSYGDWGWAHANGARAIYGAL